MQRLIFILGIETATDNCSVGLVKGQRVIAEKSVIARSAHSEKLIDFIASVLEDKGRTEDLDGIAISIGPGSYTGLRIGLSTAKGLAFPANIPLLPIPTFSVLNQIARQEWPHQDVLLFIKSHRDYVYFKPVKADQPNILSNTNIKQAPFARVIAEYPRYTIFVGDYKFKVPEGKVLHQRYPRGRRVAQLGAQYYDQLIQDNTLEIEPFYLTGFPAEKWAEKKRV